jgi:LCP family protein required for cell wall assembly
MSYVPSQGDEDSAPPAAPGSGPIADGRPNESSVIADPVGPAISFAQTGRASRAIIGEVPEERPNTRPRRARGGSHRGLKITLIIVLAVILVIGGALAWLWISLGSKLNQRHIDEFLGSSRPPTVSSAATATKYPGDPFAGQALNILVLGTDSRDGANAGISADHPGGARSDTQFIAHVSADRTRVDAVSIPRDTWITMPDCVGSDGEEIPQAGWGHQKFNSAFFYGAGGDTDTPDIGLGAACAIRAVEAMSNVRINAYMVVDFMGFVNVVNAVDGVDVNLRCPIYSPNAGLDLPAGINHLDGVQAVAMARARTGDGLGGGSDLERINRQHVLFDSILAKVYALNYVTNFPQLYNLVSSVVSAVTTDLGDLTKIAGFAYSLRNLSMADVAFTTVPIADVGDGSNVYVLESEAEPIWDALNTDRPVGSADPSASDSASPSETESTPTDPTQPTDTTPTDTTTEPPLIQSEYDC